ncbi:hypothetical protein COOONC_16408 [Cooperia oncophora]
MKNEKKKNFDASTIVRAYQKITLEDAMNLTKLQKAEHKRISALREQELRFGDAYVNTGFEKDLSQNDMTVTPARKQLDKAIASGESLDSLYALFSELLDRKLKELNITREQVKEEHGEGEDIQDDYMRQMTTGSNAGSSQNIRQTLNNEALQLNNPYLRNGRRQSTGGMRDRKKTDKNPV